MVSGGAVGLARKELLETLTYPLFLSCIRSFSLHPLEPQDLSSKGYAKQQLDEDDSDNEDEDTDVEMEDEASRGAAEKATATATNEAVYETAVSMDATASSSSAQSVRPQIIVTPRKMASAIESATAAVLAKNRKTSLEECTTNEVPLEFIPVCVFGANRKNAGGKEAQSSSKTTVIVRAGCSSVS